MTKQRVGKRRKSELVFDPQKRREFLSGFRKRKQQRREKAKTDLEKQVKEEKKRIKQDLRDGFHDQFKKSFAPIELEGQLKEEEYDDADGNVTVQIVELTADDIAKSNNWIGSNRPVYEGDEASENELSESEPNEEENTVPGFGTTLKKPSKKLDAQNDVEHRSNNTDPSGQRSTHNKKFKEEFKSKRAMAQYMAKQAQSSLRQSKAFQTKDKLERVRNIKKARIAKDKRIKLQKKREKHKKNTVKSKQPSKKFGKKGKTIRKSKSE